MERLGALRARLASLAQLAEVVGAMRALAAMRLQQAAALREGAGRYAEIVAAALSQAVLLAGPAPSVIRPRRPALLLFAAEHGFVGSYAEGLARAAVAASVPELYVVGARGARLLDELGRPARWAVSMTPHAAGIPALARRLAAGLVERLTAGAFTELVTMFGSLERGGGWRVATRALLPPDFRRFRAPPACVPPLSHLPPRRLLDAVVGEYLLADLVHAATESLAAENAARLRAMAAAADNIDRRLDELRAQERVLRQEQITDELLDVLNGAEALRAKGEGGSAALTSTC